MNLAIVLIGLGFGLAYVNGANDVSKGIATLVGSGVADYRSAVLWGAIWTAAGGLSAAALAGAMVATFGAGLLTSGTAPTIAAAIASLVGAALWVLIATRTGLPVSTTHAIVGSIAGVGAVAYGMGGVQWSALGAKILVPLVASPLVSLGAVLLLLRTGSRPSGTAAPDAPDCLCAGLEPVPVARPPRAGAVALMAGSPTFSVTTGALRDCAVQQPRALRLTLDHAHWLTSGATSFARGLNDAPKIVALVLAASAFGGAGALVPLPSLFALVACGMAAGSLFAGRRVTRVLAERVTPMSHREGFVANAVTACLVAAGAILGLPMSTTHVSSGGIVGVGGRRASLDRRTLRDIALAWVATLPGAALLGVGAYAIGRLFA